MGIRPSLLLWLSFTALTALCLLLQPSLRGGAYAGDKSIANNPRKGSGLPIPRFASMRSDDVNVRTGRGGGQARTGSHGGNPLLCWRLVQGAGVRRQRLDRADQAVGRL